MNRRLARVALIASAVWPAVLAAQGARSDDRPTWWGLVALGAGGARDSGFHHSTIGGAFQVRHLIVIGRVSIATPDYNRMEDAGLLVGVATRPSPLHFSVAAGLSAAHDNRGGRTLAFSRRGPGDVALRAVGRDRCPNVWCSQRPH